MDQDAVIDCISEEDFNKVLNVGIGDGYEECIPITQFSNFSGAIFGADNALIGWKGQDFSYGYIEGFYEFAHSTYKLQLSLPDVLVYPTIYNYRHYIEIALKEILFDLQLYFSEPIVSNFGHNLRECLNQVLTIIGKHNISFFIPEEVARVILEIHELDRNNTYFRYIFQDTGELSQNYNSKYLDLRKLHYMMNTVHNYFSTILILFSQGGEFYNKNLDFYFKVFISKLLKIKGSKINQINNILKDITFQNPECTFRYCVELDTRTEIGYEYIYKLSTGSFLSIGHDGNKIQSVSVSSIKKCL